MPLKQGKSKKTVSSNIKELMDSKPSPSRAKAIKTLSKKRGISPKKAKQTIAIVIALETARKPKPIKKKSRKSRKA